MKPERVPRPRTEYQKEWSDRAEKLIVEAATKWEQDPASIAEFLQFRSQFHRYSARNTLLMLSQNPNARFVGAYGFFRKMGHYIVQGEHGMRILRPNLYREYRISPTHNWRPLNMSTPEEDRRMANAGGYEVRERVVGYSVGTVFDVTQTTMPPEEYPKLLGVGYTSKHHARIYRELVDYVSKLGGTVRETALPIDTRGVCRVGGIDINRTLGDTQKLDTLCHELGHYLLGHVGSGYSIAQKEFEADAFSMLLSTRVGIEVTDARKAHLSENWKQYRAELLGRGEEADIETLLSPILRQYDRIQEQVLSGLQENILQEETAIEKDGRLFLDMDGTLARFHDENAYLERMYEQGFFRHLEPFDCGLEGVRTLLRELPDTEVYILSSCIDSPTCQTEKNSWLDEHLPEIDRSHRIFPPVGADKTAYIPGGVKPKDVLLDDYNHNLEQWQEAGGRSVKFVNNINDRGLHGELWPGQRIEHHAAPEQIARQLAAEIGVEYPTYSKQQALRDGIYRAAARIDCPMPPASNLPLTKTEAEFLASRLGIHLVRRACPELDETTSSAIGVAAGYQFLKQAGADPSREMLNELMAAEKAMTPEERHGAEMRAINGATYLMKQTTWEETMREDVCVERSAAPEPMEAPEL